MKNDGGPAFPHWVGSDPCNPLEPRDGMSLRDWFAGMALQGFVSRTPFPDGPWTEAGDCAYKIADAMLAARGEADDGKESD